MRWFIAVLIALVVAGAPRALSDPGTTPTLKVLIADTGVSKRIRLKYRKFLSKEDLKSKALDDWHGHGTHIFGIIAEKSCRGVQLIPCVDFKLGKKGDALQTDFKCLAQAIRQKVDIVNYSAGGRSYYAKEHQLVKILNGMNTTIVTAAGNDSASIFSEPPYYPAAYREPNIVAVGSIMPTRERAPTSNYGKNTMVWEIGHKVYSFNIHADRVIMSGTSQATAAHTARLVAFFCNKIK